MWVQVPALLLPWHCPGHVPVHQEARPTAHYAAANAAHGFVPCMCECAAARPISSVLMHVHCSIKPHFQNTSSKKKNYEFHDGDSRALNQVQGPSTSRTQCDCTGHAHRAGPEGGFSDTPFTILDLLGKVITALHLHLNSRADCLPSLQLPLLCLAFKGTGTPFASS